METDFSETSVHLYQATMRQIIDDGILYITRSSYAFFGLAQFRVFGCKYFLLIPRYTVQT